MQADDRPTTTQATTPSDGRIDGFDQDTTIIRTEQQSDLTTGSFKTPYYTTQGEVVTVPSYTEEHITPTMSYESSPSSTRHFVVSLLFVAIVLGILFFLILVR